MRQYEKFKENGIPLPDACPKCKGQICDLFRENGECNFGENCKFLHPEEYKKKAEKENVTGRFAAFAKQNCRFANSGKCMKGDKCESSHENANMNKDLEKVHIWLLLCRRLAGTIRRLRKLIISPVCLKLGAVGIRSSRLTEAQCCCCT